MAIGFESPESLIAFIWDLLLQLSDRPDDQIECARSNSFYKEFVEKVKYAATVDFLGEDVFDALPLSESAIDWEVEYLAAANAGLRPGCNAAEISNAIRSIGFDTGDVPIAMESSENRSFTSIGNVESKDSAEECKLTEATSDIVALTSMGKDEVPVDDGVRNNSDSEYSVETKPLNATSSRKYKTRGKRLSAAFLRDVTDAEIDDNDINVVDKSAADAAEYVDNGLATDYEEELEDGYINEEIECYSDMDDGNNRIQTNKFSKPTLPSVAKKSKLNSVPSKKTTLTLRQKLVQQMRSRRKGGKR
jgi:hypothetical protein